MKRQFAVTLLLLITLCVKSQSVTGFDQNGDFSQFNERGENFNPHSKDSTKKSKVIPKGIYVWTVDRKLGDIRKAEVDTLPYLFPQSTLSMGRNGQYNTIGTNYSARLSRIFIDRQETNQFFFSQLYDQVQKTPDEWHFTNTLSPITNLTYDNCGDKNNGEDHLDAKFAVNAGKRLGLGFDLDYAYARGYYQNQSTSHFNATLYASYLGDRYQLHTIFTARHQKAAENGGVTNDDYITHPELFSESYADNEIPTFMSMNWNRNNSQHFFLTHRYSLGFYKKVKMTEEEIKARQFAVASQKEKAKAGEGTTGRKGRREAAEKNNLATGRPKDAKIAGKVPTEILKPDSIVMDSLAMDTTRIQVSSKAMADSLLSEEAKKDSLDELMKNEFVPVTSFIHTFELDDHDRIYQSYSTPDKYYANTYYDKNVDGYTGTNIYDQTKYLSVKNTAGVALLEGFNKWARAGIKVFATHEYRRFDMPQVNGTNTFMERWTEQNISIGGRISKTQGHTLHYGLNAESWIIGEDAGQLKLDFNTDLNFPIWGDTVRLAANAYFHTLHPSFYERHFHSKHLWWDNSLDKTIRTRVEGLFTYDKTNTRLRVAIEEIQNYIYFGMGYQIADEKRTGLTARVNQFAGNLNVLTAQIDQKLKWGPLHWDNVLTYQSSSNHNVLPLPTLNVFTNLYFKFTVAKVLRVELGGSATYFTKYKAPDFCPQLNQFAIQETDASRMELGDFPIIDAYANLHLKHARFFVMMNNIAATSFNKMAFLAPHYPLNRSVMHMGVSWNFFN